jgi:tol-pal system protein YbgF
MMSARLILVLAGAIVLTGCEALMPAQEDPLAIRLAELEQRLAAIERIVENQSLVQLTSQVDALERRADQLQGRTETIEYNAEETATRQRNLYTDLDARIQALEASLERDRDVLAGGRLPPGELPVPGGSDRDNYQVAFELVKEERYDLAATSFERFLKSFPDSELADNAQYWLAESHYAAERFEKALEQFEVVINDYPRSRKVPDALLKMGYCNYNLKRWDAARRTLTRVQQEYPETTAARLAGDYLKRMAADGV